MPKIVIDDVKGLVQSAGKGVTVTSELTFAGHENNINRSLRKRDRYYLNEYFMQRPLLNASLTTGTDANREPANKDFETKGGNMADAQVTFDHDYPGVTLTTAGADNDGCWVLPHEDANQTAWGVAGMFDSQREVEWECAITTGAAIATQVVAAGLKMTDIGAAVGTAKVATDTDQAYFLYSSGDDADASGTLADNTVWHVVVSSGGSDFVTALPITVAANTFYHLKLTIDSDRKVRAWVNGVKYKLAGTANTTGAAGDSDASTALATNKALIPFAGTQALTTTGVAIRLHYMCANRKL